MEELEKEGLTKCSKGAWRMETQRKQDKYDMDVTQLESGHKLDKRDMPKGVITGTKDLKRQ